MSRQIASLIATNPTMKQAEKLRSKGKHDEALDLLESFWNGSVTVKDEQTGKDRSVSLAQFKPLMFTPAERRMLKVKRWRLAVQIKTWWEEAVRKGEVKDPNYKSETDSSKSVDTVTGIVDTAGTVNSVGGYGAEIGSKIESMKAKAPSDGPKPTIDQDIHTELGSLNDTHTISDSSDSNYEASKFQNKGAWAEGIMSVIGDAVSLVSSVTSVISLILDKKASKADVASQISTTLSQASTTAGGILETIEEARGSELTTQMFHWVPGLSIFSNGFAAIASAVSLVQKAIRLFNINKAKGKTKEKEKEDLKLALKRVWVRASQQVEQDAFSTAKSLTNTGLAIAEVATAGGFGIPRLAQITVSAASAVHNFGHQIADSARAYATKGAREGYFAAHKSGSAEKLIRTDPLAAAETIISRAGEGDQTCLDLLKSYDIDIPGLTGPSEQEEEITTSSGKKQKERMFSYKAKDTQAYKEGLDKLMNALKESDEPQTILDKIKGGVKSVVGMPGKIRDRWRQAVRIRDVRNKQSYGGVSDRGTWWAFKQTIFGGESGVNKLSETTAKRINEAFEAHKKGVAPTKGAKAFTGVDTQDIRQKLLDQIQPEEVLKAKKEQSEEELRRPKVDISAPLTSGQSKGIQTAGEKAKTMPIGRLANMMRDGRPKDMDKEVWKIYVAVYAERFKEQAAKPVGAGKGGPP